MGLTKLGYGAMQAGTVIQTVNTSFTDQTHITAQSYTSITGADENGSAIESADPKDWGVTYAQVAGEKTLLQSREPMRLLRVERDRLLAETDWTALGDVTMSSAMKTYRQALRDLPANSDPKLDSNGALDMSSVKFPTKPS